MPAVRFGSLVRHYNKEARAGRMLPFVIRTERRLVGQMHLFGIAWGSLLSAPRVLGGAGAGGP